MAKRVNLPINCNTGYYYVSPTYISNGQWITPRSRCTPGKLAQILAGMKETPSEMTDATMERAAKLDLPRVVAVPTGERHERGVTHRREVRKVLTYDLEYRHEGSDGLIYLDERYVTLLGVVGRPCLIDSAATGFQPVLFRDDDGALLGVICTVRR